MSRYRRELTQPDKAIARLAEDTKRLREELQAMVTPRRRSDGRLSLTGPDKSKPRKPAR